MTVRPDRAAHRFSSHKSGQTPRKVRLVFRRRLRYHVGMNTESVENIARKLAETVPEGLRSMREDLEQNFRSVLQASLNKLDLVTREEFEVQEAVLAKTREKLEALEAQVSEMERS
jgi:BMFP domain-containing protein YqiC